MTTGHIEARIARLLRIAARDDGAQGKTAARIARQLMDKHGVEVTLTEQEDIDWTNQLVVVEQGHYEWTLDLLRLLSNKHHCDLYYRPLEDQRSLLSVTGHEARVDACLRAFHAFVQQMREVGTRIAGKTQRPISEHPSYRLGCTIAIREMFARQEQSRNAVARKRGRGGLRKEAAAMIMFRLVAGRAKPERLLRMLDVASESSRPISTALVRYLRPVQAESPRVETRVFSADGEVIDIEPAELPEPSPHPPEHERYQHEGYYDMRAKLGLMPQWGFR